MRAKSQWRGMMGVFNAMGAAGLAMATRDRLRRSVRRLIVVTRGAATRWPCAGEGKPADAAGAIIDATALGVRHLDAKNVLHNDDAISFEAAGGLIVRRPTHTNLNDLRLVDA
jgi:hypothetical protein